MPSWHAQIHAHDLRIRTLVMKKLSNVLFYKRAQYLQESLLMQSTVLTLSKLDSALLLVTPVDVQPVAVVQRALKMFEGELDTNDISLAFQVESSYIDLQVDWIKADPSRLLQVLINLTTNAIKFTHTQEKRTIVVSIGASTERPSSITESEEKSTLAANTNNVAYFPSRAKRKDTMTGEDWGTGEEIYILFAVQVGLARLFTV